MKSRKYTRIIRKIQKKKAICRRWSLEELQAETGRLREALQNGKEEKKLLADAFAAAAEAAFRALGLDLYPVQLLGGVSLSRGHIAQMKTGEGKTLVALLPSYLYALSGQGVHVVTCNDYLAQRDAEELRQVYRILGLSVGCVTHSLPPAERRAAYACDVTYVTASELGFDYLRDNRAQDPKDKVLRGLHCCILDEVDSILIDDARTPLILSGSGGQEEAACRKADCLARNLREGEVTGDFIADTELKQIRMTAAGLQKAERFLGAGNLASPENLATLHDVEMAVKAHTLMKRDVDYIVDEGKVKIIDSSTGRILEGRRYSDGLHQAIEAKEGVKILGESQTLASITYQAFFNKYQRKCGMTGTIGHEGRELKETYGMDTDRIPTNRPVLRTDREDVMFVSREAKFRAIVKEVKRARAKGQPVLIGTGSVEDSEILSEYFRRGRISHSVLNAKRHAYEARIVAQAGRYGAVTIATNMAGRGTDIKLDRKAKAAGGLKVIGTGRAESRRIDDQLIGRAGRQGDPGESVFFLSLEDPLLKQYGAEKEAAAIRAQARAPYRKIRSRRIRSFVKKAQKKAEGVRYMERKSVREYDQILNVQRDLIYEERDRILERTDMDRFLTGIFKRTAGYAARSLTGRPTPKTGTPSMPMICLTKCWR